VSPDEAARYLGISRSTLYRRIRAGHILKVPRHGSYSRIDLWQATAWMSTGEGAAAFLARIKGDGLVLDAGTY
jgi:excisionase family DNA binding protein